MNWRERTLLALAVVGFVVPNTMTALFVVRHGLTFDGYLRHWGESLPATQLVRKRPASLNLPTEPKKWAAKNSNLQP